MASGRQVPDEPHEPLDAAGVDAGSGGGDAPQWSAGVWGRSPRIAALVDEHVDAAAVVVDEWVRWVFVSGAGVVRVGMLAPM